MKTRNLTQAAMFAVIIAIATHISVPFPVIPFTLQVFAVSLTGLMLRPQPAVLAVLGYILLGFIGLPVFSQGRSGLSIILSPTFGFILGFIPMVYIISTHRNKKLGLLLGNLSLYLIALPILYINVKINTGASIPISKLIIAYWLTFVPTDFISLCLSYTLSKRTQKKHIVTMH